MLADRMVLLDHLTRGRVMFGVGPGALPVRRLHDGHRGRPPAGHDGGVLRGHPRAARRREAREPHHRLVHAARRPPAAPALLRSLLRDRGRRPGLAVRARASPAASARRCCPSVPPARAASTSSAPTGRSWRSGPPSSAPPSTAASGASSAPCTSPTRRSRPTRTCSSASPQWVDYFQRVAALPLGPDTTDVTEMADAMNASGFAVIGTVDDAIAQVQRLVDQSGGFGTFLNMAHEWADRSATWRSYELLARVRVPALPGVGRVHDREPRLGGREPARVHERRHQRHHDGGPDPPPGEGRRRPPRPSNLQWCAAWVSA